MSSNEYIRWNYKYSNEKVKNIKCTIYKTNDDELVSKMKRWNNASLMATYFKKGIPIFYQFRVVNGEKTKKLNREKKWSRDTVI